ncbi:MAG: PilZ domain-containing protein [Deltaproteobacteria bacterium]|nr:PilZ domain-containing protein [Deltaproteobacteria bacterium]
MVDGLEKRKFRRLQFPLEVAAEIVSARGVPRGHPTLHVKSRNISMGGICLETKSIEFGGVNLLSGPPFARENRLRLSVELIPREPPFEATGEVHWYDISSDIPEFIYRVGVAFIEIEGDGKNRLSRFLKSA